MARPPEPQTAVCHLCQPDEAVPAHDLLEHLRVLHPGQLDDLGMERWPDGRLVIEEDVPETVAGIGWAS